MAKKITESLKEGEKFKVKDDELEFKVLEGQEETDFLEKCKSDIAQQVWSLTQFACWSRIKSHLFR